VACAAWPPSAWVARSAAFALRDTLRPTFGLRVSVSFTRTDLCLASARLSTRAPLRVILIRSLPLPAAANFREPVASTVPLAVILP
jgi:hypothetical protein